MEFNGVYSTVKNSSVINKTSNSNKIYYYDSIEPTLNFWRNVEY